jgi:hypothetical protein
MISVQIEVPEAYRKKAEYIFQFFSLLWGLPVQCTSSEIPEAHIIYSSTPEKHAQRENSVVIKFDETLYMPHTVCKLLSVRGRQVWSSVTNSSDIDFVGSAFRLLNMLDELQVCPGDRDDKGTFTLDDLPEARKAGAHLPLADTSAQLVLDKLLELYPHISGQIEPTWPGGAKYVIASTHDTDIVNLGAPTELIKHLLQLFLIRDRTYLEMCFKGLRYIGDASNNPVFGFPLWLEYETANRMRSCFYLYSRIPGIRFHIGDCKSDVFSQKIDWNLLRSMASDGWEFGFHPPINAKFEWESFALGKKLLEAKLGVEIRGLRHHWWALDWIKPYKTLRKHQLAGYEYDSSLAWCGGPGFRAGTSFPFQPFDLEHDAPLRIYELPTCLMDGHIVDHRTPVTSAVEKGAEIVDAVRQIGGMCVIDWHTESICDSMIWKNIFSVLKIILDNALSHGDVWIATPSEIVDHWRRRAMKLSRRNS